MPILIGPTYEENQWTTDILFSRYKLVKGFALLIKGTTVTQVTYPYLGDLLDGGYDYIFLVGHREQLSPAAVQILIDAGYGEFIQYP